MWEKFKRVDHVCLSAICLLDRLAKVGHVSTETRCMTKNVIKLSRFQYHHSRFLTRHGNNAFTTHAQSKQSNTQEYALRPSKCPPSYWKTGLLHLRQMSKFQVDSHGDKVWLTMIYFQQCNTNTRQLCDAHPNLTLLTPCNSVGRPTYIFIWCV